MQEEEQRKNEKEENKESKRLIIIFLIIFCILFCAAAVGIKIYNDRISEPPSTTQGALTTQSSGEKVKNPIDFASLQKKNDEIYAWIKIDDTKIDYPIVQSGTDDEFYLRHKAEDKSWSASGAVYTESANSKDFHDFVTVIYGHNGYSDSMFTTLHYFEKKDFFDSHPYFYIYTPSRRLTYQVVSAFKYDNRHILNSFDFARDDMLTEFLDTVKNPDSTLRNVRTDLDCEVKVGSNVVVLSTCITNQKSSRYLVCGVLVKDEETY